MTKLNTKRGGKLLRAALFLAGACLAAADEPPAAAPEISADRLFQEGRREASLNNGLMFSPFLARQNRAILNYTLSEVQLGVMLSDVREAGMMRGNFEVLAGLFGGGLFEGAGNYVSGATLWLRYNFVPKATARLVPYLEAGAGLSLADVDRHLLGETFNFNLDLCAGARYLLSAHWSVNLEYRYQHISNANLSANNLGINADGLVVGFSYLF